MFSFCLSSAYTPETLTHVLEFASMSLFFTVVETLFNNWTALQLAVEHQLGGTQSKEIAKWMVTVVENFFKENDNVLAQEIAEYMEDLMNNEFNTLCEDGSLEEMGESLCKYFQLIKDGNEAEVILELKKFKGSSVHLSKTTTNHDNSTLNEENDLEGSLQNHREDLDTTRKSTRSEPDEDGWVTVTKGKKP